MKPVVLGILCATIVLNIVDVDGLDLKELIFPRFPVVTRVRHMEEGRALGDQFAVFHTLGLIERFGYPAEEHKVTTEDGYNIVFFRIPGSPKSPAKSGKPVILLQHGLFASSDIWVLAGPKHDLAFMLADAGYDVWIGNVRGNSYGRSHTDLSPLDRDFWKFSFHEMGVRDLRTMVDHALKTSGQTSLFYIGHSMGTTMAFVLLSEKPEYNEKIRLLVALAPIAFWNGPPNPLIGLLVQNGNALRNFFESNDIHEIAPQTRNNIRLGRALCSDNSITQPACVAFIFLFAGNDPKQLNTSYLPQILSYFPAGGSVQTVEHYRQNIMTGAFQKYDLGYTENIRVYGKKKPPIYDVKKVSAPVALIYGMNDAVSIISNTVQLAKRLQNVVTFEPVPYDSFNHFDFTWGVNANDLLYNRVIELMSARVT